MADADALHALIQGNVDDIHRPRVTDSLLQLTEKSCRRRRIPIPMTIASHVTGIGRLPDCYVYILIQEGAGAIGGLKAAVRAAFSGMMPHLLNQLELAVDALFQMVSLIKVRAADTTDAQATTGNLVHPMRLFEACQPVVDLAHNVIAKLDDRQRPAQGPPDRRNGGGGGGGGSGGGGGGGGGGGPKGPASSPDRRNDQSPQGKAGPGKRSRSNSGGRRW